MVRKGRYSPLSVPVIENRCTKISATLESRPLIGIIRYLKSRRRKVAPDTALASEPALRKDWLRPEEEEAWNDL
jgi:hypothetical protein